MEDIVARVPLLSFIDMRRVLVFGRAGRTGAEGAFATCHCLALPPSEPGYYFWRDRSSGQLTRRSEWFVTKSPSVSVGGRPIDYMMSFALPRYCDQTLARSRKEEHYGGDAHWIAKLDTVVHELYHIDPAAPGIRQMERADGTYSANCHGGRFFEQVVDMVHGYLATKPDPQVYDFLKYDHADLCEKFGGVVGTTFSSFPSFPQRYTEILDPQPEATSDMPSRIEALKVPKAILSYTEEDLVIRQFFPVATKQQIRNRQARAA